MGNGFIARYPSIPARHIRKAHWRPNDVHLRSAGGVLLGFVLGGVRFRGWRERLQRSFFWPCALLDSVRADHESSAGWKLFPLHGCFGETARTRGERVRRNLRAPPMVWSLKFGVAGRSRSLMLRSSKRYSSAICAP